MYSRIWVLLSLVLVVACFALGYVTYDYGKQKQNLKAALYKKRVKVSNLEDKLRSAQTEVNDLLNRLEGTKRQVAECEKRVQTKTGDLNTAQARVNALRHQLKNTRKKVAALEAELAEAQKAKQELVSRIPKLRNRMQAEKQALRTSLGEKIKGLNATVSDLRAAKQGLLQEIVQKEAAIKGLRNELAALRTAKKRQVSAKNERILRLERTISKLETSLGEKKKRIERILNELTQKDDKLSRSQDRINAFKQQEAYYISLIEQAMLECMASRGALIGEVYFELGEADEFLRPRQAQEELSRITHAVQKADLNGKAVLLQGHANPQKYPQRHRVKNAELSANRAEFLLWKLNGLNAFSPETRVYVKGLSEYDEAEKKAQVYLVAENDLSQLELLRFIKTEIQTD